MTTIPNELQEILQRHYETGLRRLLEQGEFCGNIDDDGEVSCYYHHPDDERKSCIFGLLFPKEMREKFTEGVTASEILITEPETVDYLGLSPFWIKWHRMITSFFINFQAIHDDCLLQGGSPENFLDKLQRFHDQYPWIKPIVI